MAQNYQTPGVYIQELNAFPNSVVEVATAIPVFIGYTQQVVSPASQGKDLTNVPTPITSLRQFEDFFGEGNPQLFTVSPTVLAARPAISSQPANVALDFTGFPDQPYTLFPTPGTPFFHLYDAIRLFYLNGGSTCYIISLGIYTSTAASPPAQRIFQTALTALEQQLDVTMVLCPDALLLPETDYGTVLQLMLAHCNKTQSRVAIFDVYGGAGASQTPGTDPSSGSGPVANFRTDVGLNYLNYGAAYFPWLNTDIFSATDSTEVSFLNLDAVTLALLGALFNPAAGAGVAPPQVAVAAWPTTPTREIFAQAIILQGYATTPATIPSPYPTDPTTGQPFTAAQMQLQLRAAIISLDQSLRAAFPNYKRLMSAIATYLNIQPAAPAMAGVYTAVDASLGVWNAPANWSLTGVVSPTVALNDQLQADMNVDAATGKSVNAIRAFPGKGTLVWGARTLDGNSQDWRYINVRRTLIMIEQSIKLAIRAYVFAPNDANTWANVKSMISTFLFNLWKQGALQGATPADSFSVQVGLGSTMTADDVLNGLMNITVLVAVIHPAEFIQLTFQQQMQTS